MILASIDDTDCAISRRSLKKTVDLPVRMENYRHSELILAAFAQLRQDMRINDHYHGHPIVSRYLYYSTTLEDYCRHIFTMAPTLVSFVVIIKNKYFFL